MRFSSSSAASSASSSSSLFSSSTLTMLRSVNWGEKLGQIFGGHCGRILKITIVFLCALGVLIGIYSARSQRLVKESESTNNRLSSAATPVPVASTSKWVIVANPDDLSSSQSSSSIPNPENANGHEYVCAVAAVALSAGWKTIIIGGKVNCCRRPECFTINQSQFLRMSYRTSAVLKNLTRTSPYPDVYKETFRNLAFLWAIHRGARYIFDAYVEEYQSAGISTFRFEEELNRQLQTLALDESLALVEERSRSRVNMFRNPYSHFGRPDVQLLPSVPGTKHTHTNQGNGNSGYGSYSQYMNGHTTIASKLLHEYPTYRICEVRPPSIEKFLEIDEGWWDMSAPALVLPGDTMPPLCTRNTLFAPEVFWALPLLPDYSSGDNIQLPDVPQNSSRIPPWYVRGLWSQSLLEDLGGSIRLTLSKVPTLQLNKDYFFQKDKPSSQPPSPSQNTNSHGPHAAAGPSKLLKRWSCRSRSTFRCLVLISKELSNSVYLNKEDLAIIDAWVKDLKSVGYSEPSMLPKRRTHSNPCLGADGLQGVSFHSALVPKYELTREEYVAERNETLKSLVAKFAADEEIRGMENPTKDGTGARDKRQTQRTTPLDALDFNIMPPKKNSTYEVIDWSRHLAAPPPPSSDEEEDEHSAELTKQPQGLARDSYQIPAFQAKSSGTVNPRYHYKTYDELLSEPDTYSQRILPVESKPSLPNARASLQTMASSSGRNIKHFRAFLQQVAAKSAQEGHAARDFPILKAMADNICPGFGPLLPYMPQNIRSDTLLIIVFTNQHYDLIPTLEVLYRSTFPNILYCGYPHESVEIFKRKYQLVEQRAFSFIPTYTKATYECVLGAIEMNYEVKGYQVITDETLLESWNTWKLDKEKVWISSNSHEKVERSTWKKFDPSGRKLARLLEGISATWKLFSYILSGSDTELDRKVIVRRSVPNEGDEKVESAALIEGSAHDTDDGLNTEGGSSFDSTNESKESFETGETAYIQHHQFKWNASNPNDASGNITKRTVADQKPSDASDLQVSDWDYFKIPGLPEELNFDPLTIPAENGTDISNDAPAEDEEILVGDEEDFGNSTDTDTMGEIIGIIQDVLMNSKSASSTTPASVEDGEPPLDDSVPEDDDPNRSMDAPNVDELMDNSTKGNGDGYDPSLQSNLYTESMSSSTPSTFIPESSVGVPLYHVEHTEPPSTTTWHKPDDSLSSTTSTTSAPTAELQNEKPMIVETKGQPLNNSSGQDDPMAAIKESTPSAEIGSDFLEDISNVNLTSEAPQSNTETGASNINSTETSSVPPVPASTPAENLTSTTTRVPDHDELHSAEIDNLLDSLHETYYNMLSIVEEYEENNNEAADGAHFEGSDYSVEGDLNYIEDSPSHRIAPKEFRHIRCTRFDDGHQSDLCFILRQYISTLNENNRRDVKLFYDASPMYYIPSSFIKPFYSVANVLLHHGVMDELALPLIFRGLALDDEWIQLNRTMDLSEPISDSTQYIYPFNLHKVYSDPNLKHDFCSKYLLRLLEV